MDKYEEIAERDFFELYDEGGDNRDLIDHIGVERCRDLFVLAYLRGMGLGIERERNNSGC